MHVESRAIDKAAVSRLIVGYDSSRHYIYNFAIAMNDGVHTKHRIMDYHRYFTDRLANGEAVVDVGCGIGAVAHSMASGSGRYRNILRGIINSFC